MGEIGDWQSAGLVVGNWQSVGLVVGNWQSVDRAILNLGAISRQPPRIPSSAFAPSVGSFFRQGLKLFSIFEASVFNHQYSISELFFLSSSFNLRPLMLWIPPEGPVAPSVFIPDARMISISSNLSHKSMSEAHWFGKSTEMSTSQPKRRDVILDFVDIVFSHTFILRYPLLLHMKKNQFQGFVKPLIQSMNPILPDHVLY